MRLLPFILTLSCLVLVYSCKKEAPAAVYDIQKTAFSDSAMVVSAHPLATKVGLDVLRQGGNAVDAAIAVQFALAVTYPVAGNIGGGGFMVIRTKAGEVATLDFREKAPLKAYPDMYLDSTGNVIDKLSLRGHLAAGVPGTVDGMIKAYERFGQMADFGQLVEPSVILAKNGFKLTERQSRGLNRAKETFVKYNTSTPAFVKSQEWQPGDLLVQTDLARTMELIRDRGRAGFYEGEVANKIVAEMDAGGGWISHEDLQAYEAQWRDPIRFSYKNHEIISMPPPSSGGVALGQLLKMVEPYPLRDWGFHSKESIHLMIEAERRVYADRARHLGDSDFYPVPIPQLLDSLYLLERMADFRLDTATASNTIQAGSIALLSESEETTHFSVVDKEGNAVSVTTTINGGYGCYTVVSGAGFLLNNEMDDFSLKPGVPNMFGLLGAEANKIEPGKRMLSSMTPTIVTKDKELYLVVGTPGGATIITSVFQTILNTLEFEMTMSEAVAAKRFHHQWLPETVRIEKEAFSASLTAELEALGHELNPRGAIGRVDAIMKMPDGRLEGAADPRGDDHAEGM